MGNNPVNPLTWNVAIVDPKTGFPSPEFQRKWGQQAASNISIASGAAPTAVAGSAAIPGKASTFMRSDAAPALTVATTSVLGIVKPDGSTITISNGTISASGGATGANPTATASDTAVNGTAATFMRSDGAPAVQKASSSLFGIVKVDGTTITATGGVISATGGGSLPSIASGDILANLTGGSATPTGHDLQDTFNFSYTGIGSVWVSGAFAGVGNWQALAAGTAGQALVTNGATAAPSWQGAQALLNAQYTTQYGLLVGSSFAGVANWSELANGTTGQVLTANTGANPSWNTPAAAPTGANPTATASDTAVNGTAATFMRSDGAPAVQKASSSLFGIVKVDGTTITATGGVISAALTQTTGSWTPTDASGGGLTFTSATGSYIKIGSLVLVSYNVTYPTNSDGNNMKIGGLPFTNAGAQALALSNASLPLTGALESILVTGASPTMVFFDTGSQLFKTNTNAAGKNVTGSFVYQTP